MEIPKNYHMKSTVLKWVRQYNNHVKLTGPGKIKGYLPTEDIKPKKTTLDEHIRIAEYYITNPNDYLSMPKTYNCSYGQVYS